MTWRIRLAFLLILLAGSPGYAKEPIPEIAARCGQLEITREQAGRLLQENARDNTSLMDYRALLKKRITEYFCTELLKSFLAGEGFPLSAENTEAELKRLYAAYPHGFPRPADGDLHRIAGEEFTQLQWSFRRFLLSRHPEILHVPELAVERYYREHQQEFMRPRSCTVRVYRAADAGRLRLLQLRIQQGSPAEKALKDFSDVTESIQMRPVPAGSAVRAGDWSAPERSGKLWQISLVEAEHPAGYVPLANAALMIRETLVRKLVAAELRKRLNRILTEQKMEFYF